MTEHAFDLAHHAPREGVKALTPLADPEIVQALLKVRTAPAMAVLEDFEPARREAILAAAPEDVRRQWRVNLSFPEETVGRMMELPTAVFGPTETVGEVTEKLRELVKHVFVTYEWIVDDSGVLLGVVTFRDLLLSDRARTMAEVMLDHPFVLYQDTAMREAMKQVLNRHYPVYPVCDAAGRLVGLARGHAMFEEQAVEISAQAGSMVGVDKEERLSTPWPRSLKLRHPWLQLNLLTAFIAAAVVGFFQHTIDRLVILAMFLPVLAGQSGNTGCQALAVALRGLTLGELRSGRERALVIKEALLGLLNGALVGLSAGVGMYVVARGQGHPKALALATIVCVAMIGSCVVSGISGALIPLALRRAGADPATASSIFLTTATDVASMGMLLGLATLFVR
jgi:magnesium transporter